MFGRSMMGWECPRVSRRALAHTCHGEASRIPVIVPSPMNRCSAPPRSNAASACCAARSPRPDPSAPDSADSHANRRRQCARARRRPARAGPASGRAPRRSPPAFRRRGRAGSPARCAATETPTRSDGMTGRSASASDGSSSARTRRQARAARDSGSRGRIRRAVGLVDRPFEARDVGEIGQLDAGAYPPRKSPNVAAVLVEIAGARRMRRRRRRRRRHRRTARRRGAAPPDRSRRARCGSSSLIVRR